MIDLALDTNHDLDLISGDLTLVTDGLEVVQSTKIRILTVKYEYFLNYEMGIPWFDAMFKTVYNHIQKGDIIKKIILDTEGVRKINSFSFGMDLINKGVLLQTLIETIYGVENSEIRI